MHWKIKVKGEFTRNKSDRSSWKQPWGGNYGNSGDFGVSEIQEFQIFRSFRNSGVSDIPKFQIFRSFRYSGVSKTWTCFSAYVKLLV